MPKCLHCGGVYEPGPSATANLDPELETLLDHLATVSMDTGICGFDYMSGIQVPGAEVESQQRHTDRLALIRGAKEAVHHHILTNYEAEDD